MLELVITVADLSVLLILGILTSAFVGVNVGGSSTGVAFGPAVGSKILSYRVASGLMALFSIAGGIIVGPQVVDTMGRGIVPQEYFTLPASIAILLFTGLGILIGNYLKISSSTSQIAVSAIVGMGIALGVLNWPVFGTIVLWWILSSVIVFWIAAVIGRYLYDSIVDYLALEKGSRKNMAQFLAIGVGCYMAFSAGASNVANAVAPLVGSGELEMLPAVLLGGVTMGIGAFVIGPRTMKTIGNDITDIPLEAALIVEFISATTITLLSAAGIPASLAVVATLCVIGLGWGRSTKRIPIIREAPIGEMPEEHKDRMQEDYIQLYNIDVVRRVVSTWMITPLFAGLLAFGIFIGAVYFGMI